MLAKISTFLKPVAIMAAQRLMPSLIHRLDQLQDWAQLSFYQDENKELLHPTLDENRVVFFGDSITEFWDLLATFSRKPYINRGISGQTTSQMLLRFRSDVISLQPKVVLILGGTNDIAGNTGPMTLEMIENNYASMSDLADANGIRVVFASVLPIHDYDVVKQSELHPPTKIKALNKWLEDYCNRHQLIYLDYYTQLLDSQGMLKAEFSNDGVHPNLQCYQAMAPVAEDAIQKALQL